jgi:DNA-directed RNA polymerase specialized sigma24 family protein
MAKTYKPAKAGWDIYTLSRLLQNYAVWWELYVKYGVEEIQIRNQRVNIHDVMPAIRRLTPTQQRILLATGLLDMSGYDAAPILGYMGSNSVSTHKSFCLRKLLKELSDEASD